MRSDMREALDIDTIEKETRYRHLREKLMRNTGERNLRETLDAREGLIVL